VCGRASIFSVVSFSVVILDRVFYNSICARTCVKSIFHNTEHENSAVFSTLPHPMSLQLLHSLSSLSDDAVNITLHCKCLGSYVFSMLTWHCCCDGLCCAIHQQCAIVDSRETRRKLDSYVICLNVTSMETSYRLWQTCWFCHCVFANSNVSCCNTDLSTCIVIISLALAHCCISRWFGVGCNQLPSRGGFFAAYREREVVGRRK
jgi:hypothetical protein